MYYFLKCGDTTKNIPFEIVKEYDYHVLMRSLKYPSNYGMSRQYYESAFPMELTSPKTKEDIIRWVENGKDYKDVIQGVANNDPWAIHVADEWSNVKREMI